MRTIPVLLLLVLGVSTARCQVLPVYPDKKAVDQYVLKALEEWKIPGCAIAIVKADTLLYARGYGFRDVENKLPVTPRTVFKIASCTKSFTAAAAGILVQQNILDWDKPVKQYLPELELATPLLTQEVTLKDLLTHRTGILDDDWSWVGEHIDTARMFEILSAMPQGKPFRSSYLYNNMAYALAGYLCATRSQRSWRTLIREDFLNPLSMNSTVFSHNEHSGLTDFAFGYEWNDSSRSFKKGDLSEHFTDSSSVCEPFAFISTSAMDLSTWIRVFILGGTWHGKVIIPAKTFSDLVRPVNYIHESRYPELSESFYCMGWEKNAYKKHPLLQHSGGLSGFKCYMSFMPEDSIGIIVLTNGNPYRFAEAVSYDLYDRLLRLPPTRWSEKFLALSRKTSTDTATKEVIISGTRPSKPLPAYTGTYFSKWLGMMKVTFENGELLFQFHRYPKEVMKHAQYDTFTTESGRVTFQLGPDGEISGMLLNEFSFQKKSNQ